MAAGAKILVVDDNPEQVNILRKVLEREGFVVHTATDGQKALELMDKDPVSLVITDMSMPEMDGITLLKTIKAANRDLPVIIITAFGEWGPYADALKEGAAEFLSKPFKMDDILAIIHRYLNA